MNGEQRHLKSEKRKDNKSEGVLSQFREDWRHELSIKHGLDIESRAVVNSSRTHTRQLSPELGHQEKQKERVDDLQAPAKRNVVKGLGLSGGGIRSSAFSCGGMVALDEWLADLSHLCTVSGGGFTGSDYMRRLQENDGVFDVQILHDMEEHLRKHSNYLFADKRAFLLLVVLFFSPIIFTLYEGAYGFAMALVFVSLTPGGLACGPVGYNLGLVFMAIGPFIAVLFFMIKISLRKMAMCTGHPLFFYKASQIFKVGGYLVVFADLLFTIMVFEEWLMHQTGAIDIKTGQSVIIALSLLSIKTVMYLYYLGRIALVLFAISLVVGLMQITVNVCGVYSFQIPKYLSETAHVCAVCVTFLDQWFSFFRQYIWHSVWASRINAVFGDRRPTIKKPELHCVVTAHNCKTHINDDSYHLMTIGQKHMRFFYKPSSFYNVVTPPDAYHTNINGDVGTSIDEEDKNLLEGESEHHSSYQDTVLPPQINNQCCVTVPCPSTFTESPAAISSSAIGFEMGKYSSAVGDVSRFFVNFFGIGLGKWISTRERGDKPKKDWIMLWFIPACICFLTAVGVAYLGLPLWYNPNQAKLLSFKLTAIGLILLWLIWFGVHLLCVTFFPKWHYSINHSQYQASLLQLMRVYPIIKGYITENKLPPRLYCSDGGHIENLGFFPLLHKQCTDIVLLDGEANPSCDSMLHAKKMAEDILKCSFLTLPGNISFEVALNDFVSDPDQHSFHFQVCYHGTKIIGNVKYIKAKAEHHPKDEYGCCCCSMNCLRRLSPHPYHSTLNQFYTPGTWSYYCNLGKDLASSVI